MRALYGSPVWIVSVLCFTGLLLGCNVVESQGQLKETFSFEYTLHKGLDCAMIHDCGYRIEVSQTGTLTRFDDPGTGTFTQTKERTLTPDAQSDLYRLLDETGFFQFPELLPTDDPRAGGGSVSVTYTTWPDREAKSVVIMKGSPLPEEAWTFMERLEAFFADQLK